MSVLHSVWIEDTCTICGSCENAAPEVFRIEGSMTTAILGSARTDGITSPNTERSRLTNAALAHREAIREAAAGCPVEAIHLVEG